MKLIKVERPKGYTGPIFDCPNREVVGNFTEYSKTLEQVYEAWSKEFFVRRPRGKLSHDGFGGNKLVVRGTGDNGLWLVAWRFEL